MKTKEIQFMVKGIVKWFDDKKGMVLYKMTKEGKYLFTTLRSKCPDSKLSPRVTG